MKITTNDNFITINLTTTICDLTMINLICKKQSQKHEQTMIGNLNKSTCEKGKLANTNDKIKIKTGVVDVKDPKTGAVIKTDEPITKITDEGYKKLIEDKKKLKNQYLKEMQKLHSDYDKKVKTKLKSNLSIHFLKHKE